MELGRPDWHQGAMRDSGASVAEGQGSRSRINLEESYGPIKWPGSWELGAKWGRGGDEAAEEGVWERGFSRQGQDCPPPPTQAEGFADARISNP